MKTVADRHGVTVSAVALNWVISKGAIPLGGARNAEQAQQVGRVLVRAGLLLGWMDELEFGGYL
jgi:aryl-alcohol dehydrogenase-like predicted oxidoreductase